MAKFLKIDGIIGTAVVLDPTGGNTLKLVATNDCSGNPVLAVQDPGGTDIAIRASNVSEAGVQYLSFDIDFSDIGTPVDSTTTLPQNAVVMDLRVIFSTSFDNDAPNLTIGTKDTPALFGASTDFNAATTSTFQVPQWTAQPNATARAVRATLASGGASAPTQGAAKVVVGYVVEPNA